MVYAAPTLAVLRERALRDLRDDGTTFTEEYVDDFINEGLSELSRFRPREVLSMLSAASIENRLIDLSDTFSYVYAVERIWRRNVSITTTLTAELSGGAEQAQLASTAGIKIGTELIFGDEEETAYVTSVTSTYVNLDTAIDGPYAAGSSVRAQLYDDRVTLIPPHNPDTSVRSARNGWDFHAGYLDLGGVWGSGLVRDASRTGNSYFHGETELYVRILGYGERERLTTDGQVAQLDSLQEEFALRKFIAMRGFKALEQDRSLFQQWLTQANNTDVSPTQLMGMANGAVEEWRRLERRMARVRRPIMG